jgi:transcriptional antiterminator RfaH
LWHEHRSCSFLEQDGVFSARLGLFEGVTDSERIAILLDMLGRKVRVVLDADAIEAA